MPNVKTIHKTLKKIDSSDWDSILAGIKQGLKPECGDCILILGPEALISKSPGKNGDEVSLLDIFCQKAIEKMEAEQKLNPEDLKKQLSYFEVMEVLSSQYGKNYTGVWSTLFEKSFDISNLHPVFYEKLPYIPFSVIINTSPDTLLVQAFEKASVEPQSNYFNYKNNAPQLTSKFQEPDLKSPIIYNLFGQQSDLNSVVLNPDHLLDFIFSLLAEKQLDEMIHTKIKNANNIIFLGFDFESWHLKILLRFFIQQKKEGDIRIPNYASPWNLNEVNTEQFFSKKFGISFFANRVIEFIDELYERIDANTKEERMVKKSMKSKIDILVENDKLQEAIDLIKKYATDTNNPSLKTDTIMLTNRYRKYNLDKGGMVENISNVEQRNIIVSIMDLSNQIEPNEDE